MLEDYADRLDETGQDYLGAFVAPAALGHLIDDILKLSRVTRAEMRRETVDLSAFARTTSEGSSRPSQTARWVGIAEGIMARATRRCCGLCSITSSERLEVLAHQLCRIEFRSGRRRMRRANNGAGFDQPMPTSCFRRFSGSTTQSLR